MMPVIPAGTATVALTQVRCPCAVSRLIQAVSVCLRALLRSHCLYCAEADAPVSLCRHLCFAGSNSAFSLGSGLVCLDPKSLPVSHVQFSSTVSLVTILISLLPPDSQILLQYLLAHMCTLACSVTGFRIWSYLSPSVVLHACSYTHQHSHRLFYYGLKHPLCSNLQTQTTST